MAGHSRWAQIKHRKAGADAKRGELFSKLARLIAAAAREGGPDPDANARLRQAAEQARAAGMPKERIERAVARGLGASEDAALHAVEYEAYGPGGSAFVITSLTDNPNRTRAQIKRLLDEFGGRLAEAGRVSWMFERRVLLGFEAPKDRAEEIELMLIDAGAEETSRDAGEIQALIAPENLAAFQHRAEALGLANKSSTLLYVPSSTARLDPPERAKASALEQALEAHPDVTAVWTTVQSRASETP